MILSDMNRLHILLLSIILTSLSSCLADTYPEMVYIEGGEFVMGCDSLGDADESPAHTVSVPSFYIGKYEVTQREWKQVMGKNPSKFRGDNRPVENVSWNDAQRFIANLNVITGSNYRLPTEAEWEFAATGGKGLSTMPNNPDSIGWWAGNSRRKSHPVGQLQPNEYGLYDMIGNVLEWCAEPYDSLAYSKTVGKLPSNYPSQTSEVVARGGNWTSEENYLRPTNRNHAPTNYKSPTVGLRLVLDVK